MVDFYNGVKALAILFCLDVFDPRVLIQHPFCLEVKHASSTVTDKHSTGLSWVSTSVIVLCGMESKCTTSGSRLMDLDMKELWEPCFK